MSEALSLFTNEKNAGSFSGLSGLLINNKQLNANKTKNVLLNQPAYTNHIIPRKNFRRNKVIVAGIDMVWQADLVDMQMFKYQNSHYRYIMTVIDVFSKFAFAVPIKSKKASETKAAFESIFKKFNRIPKKIHIDGGTEFLGVCKQYLISMNIKTYITESKLKASIVERFNRTLKSKMWKMFTKNKNKKYLHKLDNLLENYNNSYHRSIKNKPINITQENENETFKILYGFSKEEGGTNELINFKFKIGDFVKVALNKNLFEKSYTSNWTDQIFVVIRALDRVPPVYKIKDLETNINLSKSFYEQQLNKVIPDFDAFEVLEETENKILAKKLNDEENKTAWYEKKQFFK